MKIRNGFVSNSSSSSFCIFLKKEDYDDVYNSLTILEKELVNHLNPSLKNAFGLTFIQISGMSGNNDSFDDFESNRELSDIEQDDLDNEGASSLFDKIIDKLLLKDNLVNYEDC